MQYNFAASPTQMIMLIIIGKCNSKEFHLNHFQIKTRAADFKVSATKLQKWHLITVSENVVLIFKSVFLLIKGKY